MHLCGPGLTTTSYKKKKGKITKSKQAELELGWRERNQRLKEMKLPKETFEQYLGWVYGSGKKASSKKIDHARAEKAVAKTTIGSGILQNTIFNEGGSNTDNRKNTSSVMENRKPNWVTGACSSKPSPTYTGSEMIGITVLHKSCLQPVFSKEAAEDAAKMRR
jgi:hypothetical protein